MNPTEAKNRKSASQAIAQFLKAVYFESIPVTAIADILGSFGFNTEPLNGIYCGDTGRVSEQVGAKTWLTIAWYRMPSGRYEITGYLS
jgi:hypothetical protein